MGWSASACERDIMVKHDAERKNRGLRLFARAGVFCLLKVLDFGLFCIEVYVFESGEHGFVYC